MATFSVHTTGAPYSDIKPCGRVFRSPHRLRPVLVRISAPWLGLAARAAGILAIVALAVAVGAPPLPVAGGVVAFMLSMAMEACQFRRRSLARRGFQLADVVEASRTPSGRYPLPGPQLLGQVPEPSRSGRFRAVIQRVENVGLFERGSSSVSRDHRLWVREPALGSKSF